MSTTSDPTTSVNPQPAQKQAEETETTINQVPPSTEATQTIAETIVPTDTLVPPSTETTQTIAETIVPTGTLVPRPSPSSVEEVEIATSTPSPDTVSPDSTIINGGNLRSERNITPETVVGQVCPGDQVASLEQKSDWVRIRLIKAAFDCDTKRVAVGTEGWIKDSLIVQHANRSSSYPSIPAGLTAAIVQHVVDGDTIDVKIKNRNERVRLIGIDTPETKHPTKPGECFGKEASAQAAKLMKNGQVVLLESDATQDNRDRYGRILRFVWLPEGYLVNYEMIVQGYAFEYTYNVPYFYQAIFKQAQTEAREQQRGLWSSATCKGERKPTPMQPTPTLEVQIVPTPTPEVQIVPTPKSRQGCDPSYPDVCIQFPPPDLDCKDVAPLCRFKVVPPDSHNFDADGNGLGCERCP